VVVVVGLFVALVRLPETSMAQVPPSHAATRCPYAIPDRDVGKYIDPQIRGYRRVVIRRVMLALPVTGRCHVVYVSANGEFFFNRYDELLEHQHQPPDVVLPDGRVRKSNGEIVTPSMSVHPDGKLLHR